MDFRAIDHEDFDLGLLTIENANALLGALSAMPADKKAMMLKIYLVSLRHQILE